MGDFRHSDNRPVEGGRILLSSPWPRLTELVTRAWFGPVLLALLATCIVSAQLDPAGDYPNSLEGPGLTVDEIFNVDVGANIADRVLAGDVSGAVRAGRVLPDHPPLGRLWLGLFHEIVLLFHPPQAQHSRIVIAAARVGSAFAFGILVWWIGWIAARWFGSGAGWGASAAVILVPRVFGHAHLASLETVLNLTYSLAVLTVATYWSADRPPSARLAAWCGLWFGLALLTKIQAIFIPIPIIVWAVWQWKSAAVRPLLIWGGIALAIFIIGWPWLWLNPVGNILKYLGHATERSSIQVWYFGRAYADKAVPWHYPWVLFATTIPFVLHIFGLVGATDALVLRTADSGQPKVDKIYLLLGNIFLPLVVFSVPGVAVYDGERLFLIVYPLCAIFMGHGIQTLSRFLGRWLSLPGGTSVIVLLLAIQGIFLWDCAPVWLSFYEPVARKLDLQPTYWGDSLTREFLTKTAEIVPADSSVDVAPVLHPFQLEATLSQCSVLRQRGVKLQEFKRATPSEYLIVFFRREYLPSDWKPEPPGYKRISAILRQDRILAGLYQRITTD